MWPSQVMRLVQKALSVTMDVLYLRNRKKVCMLWYSELKGEWFQVRLERNMGRDSIESH